MDDIIRSFILAGVAEAEAATDMGYTYLLRLVARKYSISYILEGHSFKKKVRQLGEIILTANIFKVFTKVWQAKA